MTGSAPKPVYDYLLVVGPSRSGTTYLYRALNAHSAFHAPEIKEGYYYRSRRRLARALDGLCGTGTMLLDVADTAWSDQRLGRVRGLVADGRRVLVVVLLRQQADQALSTMAYRRSRVLPAVPELLNGRGGLERAAVRDTLTVEALERIFALDVDVLIIGFDALVSEPRQTLDVVARLCGAPPFAHIDPAPINPAQVARFAPLAALAKLAATALRTLGMRRALQALKDDARVVGLVFRPARAAELPVLSKAAAECLDQRYAACVAAVEAAGEPLGAGVWIVHGRRASCASSR